LVSAPPGTPPAETSRAGNRATAFPAGNSRQEMDLAVRGHGLQQAAGGDVGADDDGDAGPQAVGVAEMVLDAGVQPVQGVDEGADGVPRHDYRSAAAGQVT